MARQPKPTLRATKDYSLFELHPHNRDIGRTGPLEESMRKHGFIKSCPIRCFRNGSGKLQITQGHHRFHVARKLGEAVWFLVDTQEIPIVDLEVPVNRWSVRDYATARMRGGDQAAREVLRFHEKTAIPLNCAISLVGGAGADSYNKVKAVKAGTFTVGDMKHANAVAEVVEHCKECGVEFATKTSFVKAISMCLLVPKFDPGLFMHKVAVHTMLMEPRRSVDDYLDLVELVYNRQNTRKKMAVAYEAREAALRRKATFGRG